MTELEITFAEFTEEDIPELTGVMTRAFDDDARKHFGEEKGGPPGYDNGDFFREWLFGYEWTNGYKVIVGGKAVAGIIVWVFDTGKNILGAIFVDPEYQRQGVGSALWNHIEKTYPDTVNWKLETPSVATGTHRFYESCGFRHIETKPSEDMPCESFVYYKEMKEMR
ncbi:MAG: GNAT family N-acetyltransferase [Planctomycetota bacterium]|jgi:GNAT superfamily N-acetyltransferase